MKALIGLVGLMAWGLGRLGARNFINFTWPQELSLLLANLGLVVMGTAIVYWLWEMLRSEVPDTN